MPNNKLMKLGVLIHDVSRLRRIAVDKALKPYNITRSQWWALSELSSHNPGGMMQTELANKLEVGKVTLGGLIDRLEQAGYVTRHADPKDRRAKMVSVTPAGTRLIQTVRSVADKLNRKMTQDLDKTEIEQVNQTLLKIKSRLHRIDPLQVR